MAKVSIIIPNWNGKEFLVNCLKTLFQQTFKDFEVVLVDNGSKDDSVEFTKRNYPQVEIICLKKNFGYVGAVNIGIKSTGGEYVAILNNDTELAPTWLEELVNLIETNLKVGSVTPKILEMDGTTIDDAGGGYSFWGSYAIGRGEKDVGQYDKISEVFCGSGAAGLFRRRMFEQIGLFDESFFAYGEETDLGFRAQLAGWKCLYTPSAVAYHVGSGTSRRIKNFVKYLIFRNHLYLLIKNIPLSLILKHLPQIIGWQVRAFLGRLVNGYPHLFFKAYFETLKNLPLLLQRRRAIQKRKAVSNQYLEKIISSKNPMPYKKEFNKLLSKIFRHKKV